MDALPPDHFGPLTSAVLFVACGLAVPSAYLLYQWQHLLAAKRKEAAARLSELRAQSLAPLKDGWCVLHGTVEEVDGTPGSTPIAALTLELLGEEQRSKKTVNHTWTERSRRGSARPFVLRTPNHGAIRVEPSSSFQLIDDLKMTPRGRGNRVGHAELTVGEEVYVSGVLTGKSTEGTASAYRSAGSVPTMTGDETPMLLSTRPLTEPYVRERELRANRVRWGVRVWLPLLILVFFRYAVLAFAPSYPVASHREVHSRYKGRPVTKYLVAAEDESRRSCETETNSPTYFTLRTFPIRIRMVRVPFPMCQAGDAAGFSIAAFALYAFFVALGISVVHWNGTRPWYAQKLLKIHGTGPLPVKDGEVVI
ncbi:MAG: hypothetical protein KBF88_12445 [Polyangiaceae bacterium]|nr:hypothetical protein [Polyangiaceae bacterium]